MIMGRTAIRGVANVLDATQKRIAFLFDNYDNISLSFSGGKDSTALFHLVNEEAKKRNRKFLLSGSRIRIPGNCLFC